MPPDPAAGAKRILTGEYAALEASLNDLAAREAAAQQRVDGLYAEAERVREQIADLREFEAEYRARLDAYLGDLRATLRMEGRL